MSLESFFHTSCTEALAKRDNSHMKRMNFLIVLITIPAFSFAKIPTHYNELLRYVQAAPDQGETNTCWFMASTGAMELLLNKKEKIKNPKPNSSNDLSESFLIWQNDFYDENYHTQHFIEEVVLRFNHGEAILNRFWPFDAKRIDGSGNMEVWNRHLQFDLLPRKAVPSLETVFLFSRGRRYATNVLLPEDISTIKEALVKYRSPVIVNYNDDGYWHVVLIVGFDDRVKGECYEIKISECNKKGSFFVRDSNGKRFEARAYNWFLYNGNAAAVVKLKQ